MAFGWTAVAGSLGCVALLGSVTPLRGQDEPLDWQFEERLRLGTILGAESAFFHRLTPHQVGVTADGNIYILDRGNHRIQVLDAHPASSRTLSRLGLARELFTIAEGLRTDSLGQTRLHRVTAEKDRDTA